MQGLGKEQIALGTASDNDVVLVGPGVAPHHARILRRDGQLFYFDQGEGPSLANGAPVAPGQSVPFDLRTLFMLGQVALPVAHPAVVRITSLSGANRRARPGSSRSRR